MDKQYGLYDKPDLTIDDLIFDLDVDPINGKPKRALWTSSLVKNDETNYKTNFIDWAEYNFDFLENGGNGYIYEVIPVDNIKVLEIDYVGDKIYYMDNKIKKLVDVLIKGYQSALFRHNNIISFKYARSIGYDAIHLSNRAAIMYHLQWLDIYGFPPAYEYHKCISFNTWDSESTVWINPNAIKKLKMIQAYKLKL